MTMTLDAKQRREIPQLMFVALHYLHLASEAATDKHSSVRVGSLAKKLPVTGDVVEEPLRERTVISADLVSARRNAPNDRTAGNRTSAWHGSRPPPRRARPR